MPKFSNEERKRIYETLIEKGKELFNEKGFYEITAEHIARAAGIAKGTFYHFFENKEHLYMVINNRIQEEVFGTVQQMFADLQNKGQSEMLYEMLCYIMEEFINNPLVMEIDPRLWQRIEEKAPEDCMEENNVRDLKLVKVLENSGFKFRYDLEKTVRILQLQFLQLSYIKKETQDIELMKIVLKALAEHLIGEEQK